MAPKLVRTFGELKDHVLSHEKVANHFSFCALSVHHAAFWERINDAEYDRGYKPGEYEKPDTPALRDMKLMTESEFKLWQNEFAAIATKNRVIA